MRLVFRIIIEISTNNIMISKTITSLLLMIVLLVAVLSPPFPSLQGCAMIDAGKNKDSALYASEIWALGFRGFRFSQP